jgi:uncharacterized protein YbaP (TraB family)
MTLRWKLSRPFARGVLASAVLFAIAGGVAHAQPASSQPAPPVPLLWKVSDADNAVYLLGSFHLLQPSDYPLSRDVDTAFADAEKLVFEIAPEEMGSPALGMQMGQAALRTDGTQLDSELPSETAAALAAWVEANTAQLAAMQMNGQVLQMFEPWFVGLMVTIVELTKYGLNPEIGLDNHMAKLAKQAGKPTAGLESGMEQIAFLDGMDRDEQLQFLQQALEGSAEGQAEIEKLHSAWRNGDAEALWQEMAQEMKRQFPKLYQRINVVRNDAWVPRLVERLEQPGTDDTLAVVGALHLLGEDGVVEKLRGLGYEVERICSACETGAK